MACVCGATALLIFCVTVGLCGCELYRPVALRNPHPQFQYELTMTVKGAPRSFNATDGYANYMLRNPYSCAPLEDNESGAHEDLRQDAPIAVQRLSTNVFRAIVPLDYFLDADYFHKGMCYWEITEAVPQLEIKGAQVEVEPMMDIDDMENERSVTLYFPVSLFTRKDPYGWDGTTDKADALRRFKSKLFEITMVAKRETR
jgi:hypothetical protein